MLEPLAVDPKRSVAPAANSMASARLVFPAPAGPPNADTRVPFADSPPMRVSLRPVHGRASRTIEALGRLSGNLHRPPVFAPWQEGNGFVRQRVRASGGWYGDYRSTRCQSCRGATERKGK